MMSPSALLFLLPPLSTSVAEVIKNGGFESGLDHWHKRSCQLSSETWDVQAGSRSCHVSGRTDEWSGPEQQLDPSQLRGETRAVLSYAIKLHQGEKFQHNWTLELKNGNNEKNYDAEILRQLFLDFQVKSEEGR